MLSNDTIKLFCHIYKRLMPRDNPQSRARWPAFACLSPTGPMQLPSRSQCPASFQERSSKSLLANVLDIDDDFRAHTLPHPGHNTNNSTGPGGIIRIPHSGHSVDDSHLVHTCMSQCTRELSLILKEIRVITDKMRKDDEEFEVSWYA